MRRVPRGASLQAVRVAPLFAERARELQCGYASPDAPEPVLLEKCEASDVAKSGFEGMPDASSRYASLGNLDDVKKMAGPTIS